MSNWVPVITAGSLDGFVAGTLVTGACFLAVLAGWRSRRRDLEADDWLEPLVEIVDLEPDPVAGTEDAVAPAEEPATGPDGRWDGTVKDGRVVGSPGSETYDAAVRDDLAAVWGDEKYDTAARDHLAAIGAARRWQEAAAARGDEQARATAVAAWPPEQPGAGPARPPRPREPSALDGYAPAAAGAPPDKPAVVGRHGRAGGHRAPHDLGDPTFDNAEGMPRPPGSRLPPRHAAPTPGLGGKMTGLFAGRSPANGSRGDPALEPDPRQPEVSR